MSKSATHRAAPLSAETAEHARRLLIYEDDALLVFNKPAGLAVQGGAGVELSLEILLGAFAKPNGKRPRLVHRLDRETSGVIVVARTKPAAAALSQAFADREVEKTYLAIVCGGAPSPADGAIDLPLRKTARRGLDIMVAARPDEPGAQAAQTRYRTQRATTSAALLELRPQTGRMHQLRAHCAAIGRPIAGDGKYGGLFNVAGVPIPGLMLHAAALEIPHPAGSRRRFAAPPPASFAATAGLLRLESALAGYT